MNLASIIDGHAASTPALLRGGAPAVDYGTLRARVSATADLLTTRGLLPGDRLAIVDANTERFVVAHLAALAAGLVSVPLDHRAPAPELQAHLAAVSAAAVVVGDAARQAVGGLDPAIVPCVDALIDGELDGPLGAVDGPDRLAVVPREAGDLAVLLFTSGTSGAPKPAMLGHGNLLANIDQLDRHPGGLGTAQDRCYCVVPLAHVFGLSTLLHHSLAVGAAVYLAEGFDAAATLDAIRAERLTVVVGPPTLWAALAEAPEADPAAVESVRLAVSGASALASEVHQLALDRLGLDVREGYGLTEAAPAVAMAVGTTAPIGSVGRPLPGVQVRLVDERGDDVLIGDPGEILVRGANVFAGYLDDVAATANVLDADGWLHTGDMAVVDDEGFLALVDRAKDLIIVSGFNVYPAEVEDVLRRHDAVAAAAVAGVHDERSREVVAAWVVLEAGASTGPDELVEHCALWLARYKCPVEVTLVDQLPRRADGKLRRRSLGRAAAPEPPAP